MSARKYRVVTEWRLDHENHPYHYQDENDVMHVLFVQMADVKQDGDTFIWCGGAYRIMRHTFDEDGNVISTKPYKVGKGGTVPWIGESAWADAARTFSDEVFKVRRLAY